MQNAMDNMVGIVESARSTPKLEVQNWKWDKASESYVQVVGDVKNISSNSLNGIFAVVHFYDKKGKLINSDATLIDYQPILSNQISPFK